MSAVGESFPRTTGSGFSGADRRLAVALFALTFVAYAWFFGGGGWNQNAQFDLTRALVEQHGFAIDAFPPNTFDIARAGGRTYANKSPGISLLAAVPYAIAHAFDAAPDSFTSATRNLYICTVTVCAVAGALLVATFFLYARRLSVSAFDAAVVSLVLAFCTYLFAYSTVFFAQVPAALFLFWSFARRDNGWLVGAFGAASVVCYYATLPAVLLIVVAVAISRWRDAVRAVAAAIPFVVFLMAYQAVCFASPFRTSIEAESDIFHTEGAALGVLVAPSARVAFDILFSRFRGLFFLSPVLLLSFVGTVIMFRQRIVRRDLVIAGGVFALFVAMNASFNNWDGGSAIGPRYILPVLPFLAIPMLFATSFLRPLAILFAAISFVFNFAAAAVNPLPSRTIRDPLLRYELPLLVTGRLPSDTPPFPPYAWKGMTGHVSVNRVPADDFVSFRKHPAGTWESEWASFNLGELFAPGSLWSIVPIGLWIVCGSLVVIRQATRIELAEPGPTPVAT